MPKKSQDIEQIKARFLRTEKQLRAQPWFKRGGWLTAVRGIPSDSAPVGYAFQVYKKHWFNDDGQGIHVGSFLDLDLSKQSQASVTMHILHSGIVPGTTFKRQSLTEPFVDKIHKEVCAWDGYVFSDDKYGAQPFWKFLDATAEGFEKQLAGEIGKICSRIGPMMDQTLKTLMATR